jgi:hypothetical protein
MLRVAATPRAAQPCARAAAKAVEGEVPLLPLLKGLEADSFARPQLPRSRQQPLHFMLVMAVIAAHADAKQTSIPTPPPVAGLPLQGRVAEVMSFSVPRAPSDMCYHDALDLLHVLCGSVANGEHRVYAYAPNGDGKCMITIPASAGFSFLDGLYIAGNTAYLADSQGPMYSATSGRLGASLYQVEWNNPCACSRANNVTSCALGSVSLRRCCSCSIGRSPERVWRR